MDDTIPYPVNAEIWAWLLSVITGVDRFSCAVLWVYERAWQAGRLSMYEAFAASQYAQGVGLDPAWSLGEGRRD